MSKAVMRLSTHIIFTPYLCIDFSIVLIRLQVSGGLEAGFEKLDNIMKQIRGDTDE